MKTFYRSNHERMIAGVCGGLGEHFDTDPNLVRLIVVGVAIFTAVLPAILLYLAAWVLFPAR